jgi:hypothetical protein
MVSGLGVMPGVPGHEQVFEESVFKQLPPPPKDVALNHHAGNVPLSPNVRAFPHLQQS